MCWFRKSSSGACSLMHKPLVTKAELIFWPLHTIAQSGKEKCSQQWHNNKLWRDHIPSMRLERPTVLKATASMIVRLLSLPMKNGDPYKKSKEEDPGNYKPNSLTTVPVQINEVSSSSPFPGTRKTRINIQCRPNKIYSTWPTRLHSGVK